MNEQQIIKTIEFPNTAQCEEMLNMYGTDLKCEAWRVDEIQRFEKTGDGAMVGWFRIMKDGKAIAEIREGVCNIFYK